MCGPAPQCAKDQWRLTADVHKSCDEIFKSKFDEQYQAFEATATTKKDSWTPHQARLVAKHLDGPHFLPDGRLVGSLQIDWMYDSVWNWVRGCHALLYGVYLPGAMARQIIPPFELLATSDSSTLDQQNSEHTELRSVVAGVCDIASKNGCVNIIRCWGGTIEFLSAWVHLDPKSKGKNGWPLCVWMLSTPMLGKLSEAIRGERVPWSGMYGFPTIPPHAIPIPKNHLVNASGYRQQVKEAAERLLPGLYSK